jgi:phosphohistidine phosphatase
MTALPERRRLIAMRHAKSSHDSDAPTDHDRPLNKRGLRDAPRIGEHLAAAGWTPDYILASDSRRTRQTLEGLLQTFGEKTPQRLHAALYAGGYDELLSVARTIPATAETILALGHNPGWEDLVQVLSGQSIVLKTSTCALMVLPGTFTWAEALRQCGMWQLENVVYAKEI